MPPQALEDPSESTSELTRKASRGPEQLSACLTSSLGLLASCSSLTSPSFTLSGALTFASIWPFDWFYFFPDFNARLLLVHLEDLLHGFFSLPLIFYHHTHLHSHLNTCCSCKPIIHFHPKGFPHYRGLSACLCTVSRTHACISEHKNKVLHREIQTAHTFSTHPIAWPAG